MTTDADSETRPAPFPLDTLWSIEPAAADKLVAVVNGTAPSEAVKFRAELRPAVPMEVDRGVAIIDIGGPLTKRPSAFSFLFDAGAMTLIQQGVELAARNEAVKAILLRIDSPGGTTDGLAELGDAILAARQGKPVVAQVVGMCCSAAYYLAAQADRVFAQRMDLVGSIGTRMILMDFAGAFSKAGVRAVPITSGEFKAAGAKGTPITDSQVDYFRGIVESYFQDFRKAILRGRRITPKQLDALADGRAFVASDALEHELIDGIQTFEQTFAQLAELGSSSKPVQKSKGTKPMMPATYAELKTACPGADAEFICSQQEIGATAEQAAANWANMRESRLAAREKALQEREAGGRGRAGVDALGTGHGHGGSRQDFDGDAAAEFNRRVEEKMAAGMPRRKACIAVAKGDRQLHEAFVRATNDDDPRVQRMIGDRFSQ